MFYALCKSQNFTALLWTENLHIFLINWNWWNSIEAIFLYKSSICFYLWYALIWWKGSSAFLSILFSEFDVSGSLNSRLVLHLYRIKYQNSESPGALWDLCTSTKFAHRDIWWNFGFLCSNEHLTESVSAVNL